MVQWALSMAILYGSALLEEDVPLLMVLSGQSRHRQLSDGQSSVKN